MIFDKPYILAMLDRLPDTQPDYTFHQERGINEGYSLCCIDLYDRLLKIGISPSIFMNYFFGNDVPGVQYVRCPKCRIRCDDFDWDCYVHLVKIGGVVEERTYEMVRNELIRDIRTLIQICS